MSESGVFAKELSDAEDLDAGTEEIEEFSTDKRFINSRLAIALLLK
jgi:hypothetical protein